jgi:diaminopimelate epimerase
MNTKIAASDNTRIMELIERAERETPFCDCGATAAAVACNRQIWLSCTRHQCPSEGALRRIIATLASAGHTRRLIAEGV